MSSEQLQEKWQVEAGGTIFETDLAEMTAWIDQGSLLRQDKVRKGNLRWIEAGKVPSLIAFFNAKETGEPFPGPVVTTTDLDPQISNPVPGTMPTNSPVVQHPPSFGGALGGEVCVIHADTPAAYFCAVCSSHFCKACPNSYGGSVKICPYCGAMCSSLASHEQPVRSVPFACTPRGSFGFGDFSEALAYPFKFTTSLIFGAVMYMIFSLGQSAAGFGGVFMFWSAIVCFMLANTLTFGVLSNTVENFTQGKLGTNFMPTFDDFSLWDDVVHPFFLMIGVYLSSFGPALVLVIAAFFFISSSVTKEMNGLQSDAARTVDPQLPYAANAARQSEQVRELIKQNADVQKSRVEALERGEPGLDQDPGQPVAKEPSEADFDRLNQMIQQQRMAQLESAIGKAPDTVAKERADIFKKIVGYGLFFLLLMGLSMIWGVFYFPAACAVAGYTQSFGATMNPLVGLDTIRRLGFDYVKILLMLILMGLISTVIFGLVSVVLSPFDLPGLGNMPAKAIGSLFAFYFSVVFACVIGFALYKAADRLELPGS